MGIVRHVLAVISGYAFIAISTILFFAFTGGLFVETTQDGKLVAIDPASLSWSSPVMLLILPVSAILCLLGGSVTGYIAPPGSEIMYTKSLGFFMTAISLLSAFHSADSQPRFFQIFLIVIPLPTVISGGYSIKRGRKRVSVVIGNSNSPNPVISSSPSDVQSGSSSKLVNKPLNKKRFDSSKSPKSKTE